MDDNNTTNNNNNNLAMDISLDGSSCQLFPDWIGIWNVGLCGGRKTGGPEEKPSARTRTNNRLNPQVTPGLVVEPRPQLWEVSALTTVPSLLVLGCKGFRGLWPFGNSMVHNTVNKHRQKSQMYNFVVYLKVALTSWKGKRLRVIKTEKQACCWGK